MTPCWTSEPEQPGGRQLARNRRIRSTATNVSIDGAFIEWTKPGRVDVRVGERDPCATLDGLAAFSTLGVAMDWVLAPQVRSRTSVVIDDFHEDR